jgi:hypothetical protein
MAGLLGRTFGSFLFLGCILGGLAWLNLSATPPGGKTAHGELIELADAHKRLMREHVALLGRAESLATTSRAKELALQALQAQLVQPPPVIKTLPQVRGTPVQRRVSLRPPVVQAPVVVQTHGVVHSPAPEAAQIDLALPQVAPASMRIVPETLGPEIAFVDEAPGIDRLDQAVRDWAELMDVAIKGECGAPSNSRADLRCAARVRSALRPWGAQGVRCGATGRGVPIYVPDVYVDTLPSPAVKLGGGAVLLCDPTL